MVLRTDLESGVSELVHGFSGLGSGHTFGIAVDDKDHPIVAGNVNSAQADFGNGRVSSTQGLDMFVAQLGRFDPAVLTIRTVTLKSRVAQIRISDTLFEAPEADDNLIGTVVLEIDNSINADVFISNNRIHGQVLVGPGNLNGTLPSVPVATGLANSRFSLENNIVRRFVNCIPYQDSDSTVVIGCADMNISNNTFAMVYNRFIAVQLVLNYNRMAGVDADVVVNAHVDNCICIGNLGFKGQVIQVYQDGNANSQILANQMQVNTTAVN